MVEADASLSAWAVGGLVGVAVLMVYLGLIRLVGELWARLEEGRRYEITAVLQHFLGAGLPPDVAVSGVTAGVFGLSVALFVFLGDLLIVLLFLVAALALPYALYRSSKEKLRKALETTIPVALAQLANEVSSGASLPTALARVGETAPYPANQEFSFLADRVKVQGMETALELSARRLRLKSFDLAAAVIKVGSGPGGDIVSALKGLSETLIIMEQLSQKLRTAAENGRRSMKLISVFAVLIIVVSFYLQPANLQTLLNEHTGNIVIAIAVLLYVVAIYWAVRVTRVKI